MLAPKPCSAPNTAHPSLHVCASWRHSHAALYCPPSRSHVVKWKPPSACSSPSQAEARLLLGASPDSAAHLSHPAVARSAIQDQSKLA